MRRLAAGLAIVWTCTFRLLWCPVCYAAGELILVIENGEALTTALRTSLSSWQVRVEHLAPEKVGALNLAGYRAQLVRERDAAALVWFEGASGAAKLHTYLTVQQRLLSRNTADPWPLAPDAAAALALSVKSVLRNTPIAPVAERKTATQPTPRESSATPAVQPTLERLAAELQLGIRTKVASNTGPSLRLAAAFAFYEPWLSRRRLGAYVEGAMIVPAPLDQSELDATFSVQDLTIGARARWPWLRRARPELALGAGIQRTQLSGRERATGERATASRTHGRISASLGVEVVLLPWLVLTPRFSAESNLRTQRYFARAQAPALETQRFGLQGAVAVGLVLP